MATKDSNNYHFISERTYDALINGHVDGEVESFTEQGLSVADYMKQIDHFVGIGDRVRDVPDVFKFPVVQVDCVDFKRDLVAKCKRFVERLLRHLASGLHDANRDTCERMSLTKARLLAEPDTTKDMLQQRDDLQAFRDEGVQLITSRLKVGLSKTCWKISGR